RTMDDYAAAKARLFMHLPAGAVAAVNCGDPWSDRLVKHCPGRPVRFSTEGPCRDGATADWAALDAQVSASGSRFTLRAPGGEAAVSMSPVGRHNIQNALCAASIAGEAFGMPVQE